MLHAIDPIVNLSTLNYMLHGLQRYGWKTEPEFHHWNTLWIALNLDDHFVYTECQNRERADQSEFRRAVATHIIRHCITPFGVPRGSEKQGGQHQGMGTKAVTWPVDFVTSMVIDGKVSNLVNFWRQHDINAGDDLMLILEDKPTTQYTLSHHPKSIGKQSFAALGTRGAPVEYTGGWIVGSTDESGGKCVAKAPGPTMLSAYSSGTPPPAKRARTDTVEAKEPIFQLAPAVQSQNSQTVRDAVWINGYWHIARSQIMQYKFDASLPIHAGAQHLVNGKLLDATWAPVWMNPLTTTVRGSGTSSASVSYPMDGSMRYGDDDEGGAGAGAGRDGGRGDGGGGDDKERSTLYRNVYDIHNEMSLLQQWVDKLFDVATACANIRPIDNPFEVTLRNIGTLRADIRQLRMQTYTMLQRVNMCDNSTMREYTARKNKSIDTVKRTTIIFHGLRNQCSEIMRTVEATRAGEHQTWSDTTIARLRDYAVAHPTDLKASEDLITDIEGYTSGVTSPLGGGLQTQLQTMQHKNEEMEFFERSINVRINTLFTNSASIAPTNGSTGLDAEVLRVLDSAYILFEKVQILTADKDIAEALGITLPDIATLITETAEVVSRSVAAKEALAELDSHGDIATNLALLKPYVDDLTNQAIVLNTNFLIMMRNETQARVQDFLSWTTTANELLLKYIPLLSAEEDNITTIVTEMTATAEKVKRVSNDTAPQDMRQLLEQLSSIQDCKTTVTNFTDVMTTKYTNECRSNISTILGDITLNFERRGDKERTETDHQQFFDTCATFIVLNIAEGVTIDKYKESYNEMLRVCNETKLGSAPPGSKKKTGPVKTAVFKRMTAQLLEDDSTESSTK